MMLKLVDVCYWYGENFSLESDVGIKPVVMVIKNLNLHVKAGEVLLLQGRNGSGKTTLLQLLAGLLNVKSGQIFWGQYRLQKYKDYYQQQCFYVGHHPDFAIDLKVKEQIFLSCHLWVEANNKFDIDVLAKQLGLFPYLNTRISQLSQGQKKRLQLLPLLFIKRPIWLLDESLTNLDSDGQNWLWEKILKHQRSGGIVLLSLHDVANIAPIKTKKFTCFSFE